MSRIRPVASLLLHVPLSVLTLSREAARSRLPIRTCEAPTHVELGPPGSVSVSRH